MREIILDTETTGLDPKQGHRIVEIGCIELINKVKTGNFFHTYINPERNMPKEASDIHGITEEFLEDKPLFSSIATGFLEFILDSALIIHNAKFDLKFLNSEFEKINLAPITKNTIVDTLALARKKFPGSPSSLDALCRKFSVDTSKRTKHGALLDAELLAEVYIDLTDSRQSTLLIDNQQKIVQELQPYISSSSRLKRVFTPSNDEVALHKELLKKIKLPIWEEEA
ncbi:DNA polymerase III subunit epsilon [Rickettsiales bacterium Ac37b]|nr:DNA polymerase III subunit epsilon [Rickettsiales bacterium Ac37b]